MLNSMIRFKGYVFEHNPRTLKITSKKNIASQSVLGEKSDIIETGDNSRVVTGEGSIHGEDCIYKFLKLFKLKEEKGSGILSLPNTKPFYAFFESLEFSADPMPNLISYKFIFIEDNSKPLSRITSEIYYNLRADEDLWDVSHKFNMPIETLIKLNPQLMRTDDVEEGMSIRVC